MTDEVPTPESPRENEETIDSVASKLDQPVDSNSASDPQNADFPVAEIASDAADEIVEADQVDDSVIELSDVLEDPSVEAGTNVADARVVNAPTQPVKKLLAQPAPIPDYFQNLAANGGAVTAIVLGAMAIVGGFFSDLALFNAILGIAFGIWGLTSNFKRLSQIGLALCGIAVVVCVWM